MPTEVIGKRRPRFWGRYNNAKAKEHEKYGPEVLYEHETATMDVIIVSDIHGTCAETWTHRNSCFWPTLLLEDLPSIRLISWNYATKFRATGRLIDLARGLLSDIRISRNGPSEKRRPIVLLLMALEALLIDDNGPYQDLLYTAGILFLGTAHHIPEKFRMLRVVAKPFRPYLPRMLHVLKDPKYIETQNARFLEMQTYRKIRIYSFYENPGVGGIMGHRVLFDDIATTVGCRNEELNVLEAHHLCLGKFPGRNDVNYRRVLYCLESLAMSIAIDHPAYHDRVDPAKTTITSEADQDLSTELSKDESAEPGPGSSAFQNAELESLSRHIVNASSPGSAVESSSSFRSLPYAGSSLYATDPTSVDEVGGHLPSSAAGEKNFASVRHVSLSPSPHPLPHTEQVSSSALQSQGFSAESHLSQSPSGSQPPIIPEISLPPRSLTSEGFLQKHSEAIIRDTTATKGWNIGTIEAAAAGGIATGGLAVASINAYTARQALHATRKNLEITKESAAAGTRSAKYAKKTFRFQRQSADKKSKNNSDRPSDSSYSSKSRGLTSSYKAKVRRRSDKQSASPTSIQRLKALPKTPSHDPSQRHIPEVNYTTGIHSNGDRRPHDIVNQRNGDMLVTAVDEEEGQPTAPNDNHKSRSIPRYIRNTLGGSGLSIKVEKGVGEGRDEDLALEDAKINPQQIQMPSSPNDNLFERRSVQSLSKESSSWHSMVRPSLDDVSAQASPRVELDYEPAERGWRAASPSAVPAHIRTPSEAEIKQVQDLDPTHSHESSLWRTIDANFNAVAGPLDHLLQSKGASSEDFLPRDLEGALKMNVLRDIQQPGSSSSASLIYCPHFEFSNTDQGVKEGYFKILGTDEDRKHFTESMASENGPRSEIVGPDEGCGGKEAKEKVGTLGTEESSEKSEEYKFATPAREETDSLVDRNIHRDKQISSAGSKFPRERTSPTEEARSLFTLTENNSVDVKQSPATEKQHFNDPKEYHDRDGLSGTRASDLDAELAEGHGKSGTENDVAQILNGVEAQSPQSPYLHPRHRTSRSHSF